MSVSAASLAFPSRQFRCSGFYYDDLLYILSGRRYLSPSSHLLPNMIYRYNAVTNAYLGALSIGTYFTVEDGSRFQIGGRLYFKGINARQFYRFDTADNSMTQLGLYPGAGRNGVVAFHIGGYGYMGMGAGSSTALREFWRFDPSGNSWTRLADFPGTARCWAGSFAISNFGYIYGGQTGSNTYFHSGARSDCWRYNPAGDSWTAAASLPVTLSIGNGDADDSAGYALAVNPTTVVSGYRLYRYDPGTDAWTVHVDDTESNYLFWSNLKYLSGVNLESMRGQYHPALIAWPDRLALLSGAWHASYLSGGVTNWYELPVTGGGLVNDLTVYTSTTTRQSTVYDVLFGFEHHAVAKNGSVNHYRALPGGALSAAEAMGAGKDIALELRDTGDLGAFVKLSTGSRVTRVSRDDGRTWS